MKKSVFAILALACSMVLVGCNNGGSNENNSEKDPATSQKTSTSKHTHTYDMEHWETNETQHWHKATCNEGSSCANAKNGAANHSWVEDTTKQSVPATCSTPGKSFEKCSVCGYERTVDLPTTDHEWESKASGENFEYYTCKHCDAQNFALKAMKYTSLLNGSGAAANPKSGGPAETLKMNANGDHATYVFNLPADSFTGDLYLNGAVDYWKDGNNNNNARGFTSRKSGEGFNLSLKLNDADITITNTKTYEESGLKDNDGSGRTPSDYSSMGYVQVGAVTGLKSGENTLVYTREESYNLNVYEICFIGHFVNYKLA